MAVGSSYVPVTRSDQQPSQAHVRSAICISVTGGPQTGSRRAGYTPLLAEFIPDQLIPDVLGYLCFIPAHLVGVVPPHGRCGISINIRIWSRQHSAFAVLTPFHHP